MKRAIYHRRMSTNVKPALQVTAAILAVALLPAPVEAVAQSDALGPVIAWALLSAVAAFLIWAWPVKR